MNGNYYVHGINEIWESVSNKNEQIFVDYLPHKVKKKMDYHDHHEHKSIRKSNDLIKQNYNDDYYTSSSKHTHIVEIFRNHYFVQSLY